MPIEFALPALGDGIEEGDVADVLVSPGDMIRADQDVLEIETGKAVVPVSCPHAGKVLQVHVQKGSKVPVGGLLLTLEATAAAAGDGTSKTPPATPPVAEAPAPAATARAASEPQRTAPRPDGIEPAAAAPVLQRPAPLPAPVPAASPSPVAEVVTFEPRMHISQELPVPAGPETRRYARELGVDLRTVTGTGPGGRITKEDVQSAVRAKLSVPAPTLASPTPTVKLEGTPDRDAFGPIRRVPQSKIRETIARNMAQSAATIPHVTNFDDADVTELERIRKGSMADYPGDVKLTLLAFVIKAVGLALRQHHTINAALDAENKQIIYKDYVNIGVAVDTERGLVVPVLRDADRLSIPQIAVQLTQMATAVRAGRFKPDDLRGGTFTISNLGAVGGTYSTPIINAPEVAILLLGRARRMPVVVDEAIEVRLMMPLSLSYDHRLIDGATAARFLNEVKTYLEVPGRLLLAP